MTYASSDGEKAGWASLSELARRLNLSVASVKKRVDRLERQGLLEEGLGRLPA